MLQEVRQRELLDHGCAEVVGGLGGDHSLGEPLGDHQPAQAQTRRQRLADRPRVGDQLGREALHGADGRAVVAVLGVVVVLQHDRAAAGGPLDQRRAPLRRQHHAERELVGRRGEGRVRRERLEHVHAQAVPVHRHGHDLQPVRRELLAARRAGRVLDADPAAALGDQGAGQERHALSHPGGHDHPFRVAGHAAYAAEVAGEGQAQLGRAARIAVVEPGVGRVAQPASQRGEPGRAREQRHVRPAGAEVEARGPVGGGRRRGAEGGGGGVGDERGGALPRHEVALRAELGVGVHDHAARDAELARQRARARERDAGGQPARAHRVAQLLLELGAQRGRAAAIQADEQIEPTGPVHGL